MCEILSEPQRTQRMPSGQRSFSSRMRHFSSVPNCSINFIRFISPLGCAFCLRLAMIGVSYAEREREERAARHDDGRDGGISLSEKGSRPFKGSCAREG